MKVVLVPPVREVLYYKSAVKIIYHDPFLSNSGINKLGYKKDGSPCRGEITEYVPRTARRLSLHLSEFGNLYFYEITFTYPLDFPLDGKILRRHRKEIIRWLKSNGLKEYTTMLEFQKRGAPHLHLLSDVFIQVQQLARAWFEIVGSGDMKHLQAGIRIDRIHDITKTKMYMSSYARKKDQKKVPVGYKNVGKFWTSNRSIKPHEIEKTEYKDRADMMRDSRGITKWRKATKRTVETKSGRRFKKWKIKSGKGFLAWGEKSILKSVIERLSSGGFDYGKKEI